VIRRSHVTDFGFEAKTVLIREKKKDHEKEKTDRTAPMSPLLERVMRAWFADHPGGQHAVCTAAGTPITEHYSTKLVVNALRKSKWSVIPQHGELDGEHVPLLPRREVPRRPVHCADGRIGEGLGVKPRRVLGAAVVPHADRVLRRLRRLHHVTSPWMSRPRVGVDPARRVVGKSNYEWAKRQTT
jgi:hypothetical protein